MTTQTRPIRCPPETVTASVLTKRIRYYDRTSLALTFPAADAKSLRELAQAIRLKQDKRPTLSLLARRGLNLYREALMRPGVMESEIAQLNEMTTPVPKPAPKSRKTP
jgi:hypothetical protein